jgi:N6-adenosine-specific RNA methylase IME4
VVSEVRETSRKPDEVYGLLERCALCDDGAGKGSVLIFCEDLFEVCRIVPSGRKLGE